MVASSLFFEGINYYSCMTSVDLRRSEARRSPSATHPCSLRSPGTRSRRSPAGRCRICRTVVPGLRGPSRRGGRTPAWRSGAEAADDRAGRQPRHSPGLQLDDARPLLMRHDRHPRARVPLRFFSLYRAQEVSVSRVSTLDGRFSSSAAPSSSPTTRSAAYLGRCSLSRKLLENSRTRITR